MTASSVSNVTMPCLIQLSPPVTNQPTRMKTRKKGPTPDIHRPSFRDRNDKTKKLRMARHWVAPQLSKHGTPSIPKPTPRLAQSGLLTGILLLRTCHRMTALGGPTGMPRTWQAWKGAYINSCFSAVLGRGVVSFCSLWVVIGVWVMEGGSRFGGAFGFGARQWLFVRWMGWGNRRGLRIDGKIEQRGRLVVGRPWCGVHK
ncbi:hypothetical protein B0J18DRAFT_168523 [Chaetomium sp. MPI-SDFR-AT-0129]|nr:hypothetical protein B0J18DRAFT_168523 [Chaetomium sp. MPI-SDFR-AT-0129]